MQELNIKRKVTIMIAVMVALLFASLNQTIVGTALPRIIAELGGMEYFSWIFTVYMLASTVTAVLVGKLSDIYGRKPFILIGLIVFIIGTFVCGLADTIVQLIVYRGIQGLGAGVIMSTSFTVVGDLFAPRERGRWQGFMGGVFGLSSVFGPTLGGYIVDHADWHWIFWIFLPIGVVALVMIWTMFPSVPKREGEKVDYWGSVFLTAAIVPLLLAFSWAGDKYAWSSLTILGLFGGALVALVLFIVTENRVSNPTLPLNLFKSSVFSLSNAIGFIMGAGMFGAIMYTPFFIQGVVGTSATISGYVMMPLTLSLVVASAIIGHLISKTGKYKIFALAGLFVMTVGLALMWLMDTETSNFTIVWHVMIVGLGLGTAFPIVSLAVQNAVEDRLLGVATAASQLFRQLGGTIGVSIMGTVMAHRMAEKMTELSKEAGAQAGSVPAEVQSTLAELHDIQVLMDPAKLDAIEQKLPAEFHDLFGGFVHMLRESLSYALTGVFFFGAVLILAAFVLTIFLKEIPLRTAGSKSAKKQGQAVAAEVELEG